MRNSLYYVAYKSVRPVVIFLLLGLVGLARRFKLLAYFLFSGIVWFLLLGKLVFSIAQPRVEDFEVVSVYFLPAVPILYSLISIGFAETVSFIRRRHWQVLAGFGPYALTVLPFVFLPYSLGHYSLDRNVVCYQYGKDMLMALPAKSLLMDHGDNPIFSAFYMKSVERLREDVLVIDTSGKHDVFGIECAPAWKYAKLYPGFYRMRNSTVSEINEEFALKGKLFTDNPLAMTNVVAESYNYYPYLLSAALWPKKLQAADFESAIRRRFTSSYERVNYESALAEAPSDDFLVQELLREYSFNTLFYSDFIMRDGKVKEGDAFQRMAFILAPPEKVLWPYIDFLLRDGRQDHTFTLLAQIKKTEGYGDVADILEKKALSVVEGQREMTRSSAFLLDR